MEKRIAILATNGWRSWIKFTKEYLEQQGWKLLAPKGNHKIMGQNRLGKDYKVDQVLNTVKASDYDA
jgi:protease I